jgi:hypothetical protein
MRDPTPREKSPSSISLRGHADGRLRPRSGEVEGRRHDSARGARGSPDPRPQCRCLLRAAQWRPIKKNPERSNTTTYGLRTSSMAGPSQRSPNGSPRRSTASTATLLTSRGRGCTRATRSGCTAMWSTPMTSSSASSSSIWRTRKPRPLPGSLGPPVPGLRVGQTSPGTVDCVDVRGVPAGPPTSPTRSAPRR